MKILITAEFYHTASGGGIAEQAKRIAQGLAALGHSVTVASSGNDADDGEIGGVTVRRFHIKGSLIKGIEGETERYQEFIKTGGWEAMINFAAHTWSTDLVFPLLGALPFKKILSTPGLPKIGEEAYDAYYNGAYAQALANYDRVVYTSANYVDKKFGDEKGFGAKAAIIPNGAGEEFLAKPLGFREKYKIKTPRLAITVANHYFKKGHAFSIEAFKKMNRQDTTYVIFGTRPARHGWYSCYPFCKLKSILDRRIRLIDGRSIERSWVVSAYQEADVFLFGSELECSPLVMFESFAAKLPFVSRLVGNVADHRDYVRVVSTPEAMAIAANDLLDNAQKRDQLRTKAFEAWQKNYTWATIAQKYSELLSSL